MLLENQYTIERTYLFSLFSAFALRVLQSLLDKMDILGK